MISIIYNHSNNYQCKFNKPCHFLSRGEHSCFKCSDDNINHHSRYACQPDWIERCPNRKPIIDRVYCVIITLQPFPQKQSRRRYSLEKRVTSVVFSRNPANSAVVLAAVIGSRTVETSAAQTLIIHGSRAPRPAHDLRVCLLSNHRHYSCYTTSELTWTPLLGYQMIIIITPRCILSLVCPILARRSTPKIVLNSLKFLRVLVFCLPVYICIPSFTSDTDVLVREIVVVIIN